MKEASNLSVSRTTFTRWPRRCPRRPGSPGPRQTAASCRGAAETSRPQCTAAANPGRLHSWAAAAARSGPSVTRAVLSGCEPSGCSWCTTLWRMRRGSQLPSNQQYSATWTSFARRVGRPAAQILWAPGRWRSMNIVRVTSSKRSSPGPIWPATRDNPSPRGPRARRRTRRSPCGVRARSRQGRT